MNREDLMFRDWVKVIGLKRQILSRSLFNFILDEVSCGEECIDPIPLTKEMLIINGWTELNKNEFIIDEYKSITYNEEDSTFRTIVMGELIQFGYVHELQHLLRMQGMKKLANYFKLE